MEADQIYIQFLGGCITSEVFVDHDAAVISVSDCDVESVGKSGCHVVL